MHRCIVSQSRLETVFIQIAHAIIGFGLVPDN